MKLLRTFCLVLLVALVSQGANAQSASSQGHSQVDVDGETARLTIRGESATALYDILLKKEGALFTECEVGSSVVVAPFACNRRPDGTTFCATSTSESEIGFIPTDICLQPKLSIIGVGSIRDVPKGPRDFPLVGTGRPFDPRTLIPGTKPLVPPCLPLPY